MVFLILGFVLSMYQFLFCNFVLSWSFSGSLKRTGSLMNLDKSYSCMITLVLILILQGRRYLILLSLCSLLIFLSRDLYKNMPNISNVDIVLFIFTNDLLLVFMLLIQQSWSVVFKISSVTITIDSLMILRFISIIPKPKVWAV